MVPPPPSAVDIVALTDTEAIEVPSTEAPISVVTSKSIAANRAKAGRLVAGVAAYCSSDMFKTEPARGKPQSKRWDHILSLESKSRCPSSLKGAARYLKNPGMISLGGGLPCSDYFPFEELSVKVPQVGKFTEAETKESGVTLRSGKHDAAEGTSEYDISIAFNYGQGSGSAQLLRFITEHTEMVCHPPYADWDIALTVGSTAALEQAYRMFCERGDYVLAEEFTFASAVETALPLGVRMVGIKMDAEGLVPEHMDEILTNWDSEARGARKPHLLYTIPTGQNPSGATQGAARRKAIYKVAQKHDVYIIEDEPYYFLQMQPYTGPGAPAVPPPANNAEFLKALVPTYLSLDVDGRVMRMDSMSKVIAPGSRVGWVTASQQIIERFIRHNEVSSQNPSGLSQLVLYKLLDESWGHEGYLKWLIHMRMEYTERRDALLGACEKYLPREIVSWNPPAAGMFLWLAIDWKKHPEAATKGKEALEQEIFQACVDEGVLLSRGSWFHANRVDFVTDLMFLRATFAAASSEKMAEAIERFGAAVRASFKL